MGSRGYIADSYSQMKLLSVFLILSVAIAVVSAKRGPKCDDGTRPTCECADGSTPSGRRPRCDDGNKPECECADGSTPSKPSKPSPCEDESKPTCVCDDGSTPTKPRRGRKPKCEDESKPTCTCADGQLPQDLEGVNLTP